MRIMFAIVQVVCLVLAALPAVAQAPLFETKASQVFLIDGETGSVLFAKDADRPVPPASLAKMMALETVFQALATETLSLSTEFVVSEHAWRTGGAPSGTATMFAALKSRIIVSDLLQGAMVQFANDACIILAEGIAGSEAAFADRMTQRARALGLTVSTFANATGLPDPRNRITMREAALLARHLQATYPGFYRLYLQPEFEWNKIRQRNRNPLIAAGLGVDGLATGFTEGSGYSVVTSLSRNGRRVFLAMGGLASEKERIEESRRILDWAMSAFRKQRLFEQGDVLAEASVYGGARARVAVEAFGPVDVLVPVDNPERLSARVVYRWPLAAPVASGTEIGTLRISSGETLLREVPVRAAASVEQGTLKQRALDALQELVFFWL